MNIIGVYLESSQSNTIYKNEFTYNDVGIYSWDQERIDIKSNLIHNNYRAGTLIGLTKDMKIENNQIKNNKIGITLDESYDNLIRNNTISKNVEGFWIDEYSGQNHIYLNDIKSNNQQVNLNTNTYQNDAESEVSTNTWQSPFKITYTVENETESYLGNYWSNYDGEDENKDAIGDTHYEIGGEEVDRYPLQKSKTYYLSPETYNTTEESETEEFDPEVPSDKYIFLWIINENNTKLSNVTVKVKRNNELISNKTTNEKGLALFSLEPGEYNVKLEKNNITAQKTIWKPAYTLKGKRLTFNLTKD